MQASKHALASLGSGWQIPIQAAQKLGQVPPQFPALFGPAAVQEELVGAAGERDVVRQPRELPPVPVVAHPARAQ